MSKQHVYFPQEGFTDLSLCSLISLSNPNIQVRQKKGGVPMKRKVCPKRILGS
jgi:hypothetical protein